MSKLFEFEVKTNSHSEMIDVTDTVKRAVEKSEIKKGLCMIFIPHTTAAVTINENADPDVMRDFLYETDKMVPWNDGYHHIEGNSAAHVKSSMMGVTEQVIIENGCPVLGTWQCIYFLEFDGPRRRKMIVKIVED